MFGSLLILSSYVLQVLLADEFGVALILLAIALFAVDFMVTSHGLPTVGGVAALILGILMFFETPAPYLWVVLIILVTVAALVGILFVGGVRKVLAAKGEPTTTGIEGLIGEVGVVREPVRVSSPGWVFVRGERWQATVAIAPEDAHKQDYEQVIGVGRKVLVVGLRDRKVVVMPFESVGSGYLSES